MPGGGIMLGSKKEFYCGRRQRRGRVGSLVLLPPIISIRAAYRDLILPICSEERRSIEYAVLVSSLNDEILNPSLPCAATNGGINEDNSEELNGLGLTKHAPPEARSIDGPPDCVFRKLMWHICTFNGSN